MKNPSFEFEQQYWSQGISLVAGLDEVGVGAWAGPVCAGAVMFKSLPTSLYQGRGALNLAYIPYNSRLKEPAREQRKNPTLAEKNMWTHILRKEELRQYTFLRQKPLENFIADFYCRELLLVIEVDGDSHDKQIEYDNLRSEKLAEYNVKVLRYKNKDITQNAAQVYQDLLDEIRQRVEVLNNPLDKGGMGDFSAGGFLVRDSKLLSPQQREKAAVWIRENALAWAVGEASVEEIFDLNILQAARLAMRRAVEQLSQQPEVLIIDGRDEGVHPTIPSESIIKGDQKSFSIAAASILAKVHRDNFMVELGKQHPTYGFESHKGYGAKQHQEALQKFGVTEHHRAAYAPIAALI